MGISPYRLSVELHVSAPTINEIVPEKRNVTPEMAARLAKYFETSEQFWLNLQDAFAIHEVKQKHSQELKAIKLSPWVPHPDNEAPYTAFLSNHHFSTSLRTNLILHIAG